MDTAVLTPEAINEPKNIDPETDSDIEFIEEVPQKVRPTPEVVDIENVCKQEQSDGIKKEPKQEPGTGTPTPSTSGIDPLEFEKVKAQLAHLTNLLKEKEKKTPGVPITKKEPEEEGPAPNNGAALVDTEVSTPEEITEGPEAEPAATGTKEPQSDTDEVIQTLEDHCAKMQVDPKITEPHSPQESAEDSGTEDKENSGIENVVSSGQEDEIVVDPSNMNIDDIGNPDEATENQQSDADKSNNNEEQVKLSLDASNRHPVTNRNERKILIHKAPVPFPASGNLMEYPRTNTYVTEALTTIVP